MACQYNEVMEVYLTNMKKVLILVILAGVVIASFFAIKNRGNLEAELPSEDVEVPQGKSLGENESTIIISEESGFSLNYPSGFVQNEETLPNGDKRFVVESTKPKQGFQITVSDFDEPGPITSSRIKRDLPDLIIKNSSLMTVIKGMEGFSFNSTDPNIGETFEVWIVQAGKLYQIQTYTEFENGLLEILKTMKFG